MRCQVCATEQAAGNRFCEDCGTPLTASAPAAAVSAGPGACGECGTGPELIDADGFCEQCGHQRVAPPRDHIEVIVSDSLAGISDRGKKHPHNDDFLALASDPAGDVLVVCDGVSNSQQPDVAATVAAEAACRTLLAELRTGTVSERHSMVAAVAAAQKAVRALPPVASDQREPPETTLVAAVRHGRNLVVGWVGDSRAYLWEEGGLRALTEDHSWVNEVVAAGKMTRAEALRAPLAHGITRSIGGPLRPGEVEDEPSLRTVELPGPGCLLLCTDGLWNYVPDVETLGRLLDAMPQDDAIALARALVGYANSRGGVDNVTVAVLRWD